MPALMTHHLVGEESIERLPGGLISTDDERIAFLLANQGPDPFFFRFRTPNSSTCTERCIRMNKNKKLYYHPVNQYRY